jgi:SAM-dependent methyltransferase
MIMVTRARPFWCRTRWNSIWGPAVANPNLRILPGGNATADAHAIHPEQDLAEIYNQAGAGYAAYADGDPQQLFAFDGPHAYADRLLWDALDAKLIALHGAGRSDIRILDAGCGPGTWLRRLVTRAVELGFSRIEARGFDIANAQIERARLLSRDLANLPEVKLTFEVADLCDRLPEKDNSVDLTVCLYSVLSHLEIIRLPWIAQELARVTRGFFVATVRPIGSPPSVFVDTIENTRQFRQDNIHDRCRIELFDGRCFTMNIHLFSASELRGYFSGDFEIEVLRGLDLFHSRFALNPRWNPLIPALDDDQFDGELSRIEEAYAASPRFIEHAAHLLLVAHRPVGVPAQRTL